MSQILAGVEEAHSMGVVHRDLKPDNIMIERLRTGGDLVKVCDFGIAKLLADEAPVEIVEAGGAPGANVICGTPEYMSPEQIRGADLDGRADILLAGRPALRGPDQLRAVRERVARRSHDAAPQRGAHAAVAAAARHRHHAGARAHRAQGAGPRIPRTASRARPSSAVSWARCRRRGWCRWCPSRAPNAATASRAVPCSARRAARAWGRAGRCRVSGR